mmetsp:Transcript_26314/g.90457  ORF Transcript_26314/g.90457 Transcript_26314/m.90457 type:complete len:269 (-) Transcript_26314:1-807(-)
MFRARRHDLHHFEAAATLARGRGPRELPVVERFSRRGDGVVAVPDRLARVQQSDDVDSRDGAEHEDALRRQNARDLAEVLVAHPRALCSGDEAVETTFIDQNVKRAVSERETARVSLDITHALRLVELDPKLHDAPRKVRARHVRAAQRERGEVRGGATADVEDPGRLRPQSGHFSRAGGVDDSGGRVPVELFVVGVEVVPVRRVEEVSLFVVIVILVLLRRRLVRIVRLHRHLNQHRHLHPWLLDRVDQRRHVCSCARPPSRGLRGA